MSKNREERANYYLYIDGQAVPVSEQVYRAYHHYARKEEYFTYDLKTERFSYDQKAQTATFTPSREDSYDLLIEEEHHQFALDEPSPENMLLQEEELHLLRAALLLLTAEEKDLIDALFYQEMSEREYAQQLGISQKGVNKRRHKVLAKLRKIIKT